MSILRRLGSFAALVVGGSSALGCLLPEYIEAAGVCEPGKTWALGFGSLIDDTVKAASSDVCGGVTVGGSFQDYVDFGLADELKASGDHDGFVARFDSIGKPVWAAQFGGAGDQFISSLTTDIFGGAIAAGNFTGSLELPGRDPVNIPAGHQAAFVTRLELHGRHHWTRALREETGMTPPTVCGVAVDRSGNVTVAGDFTGTVDFGGKTETGKFAENIFVAHYDPDGELLWTRSFQTEKGVTCSDLAADKDGNILMTGSYRSTIDFGEGPHEGPQADVMEGSRFFVLKLNSAGAREWSQGTNSGNYQYGLAITTDADGNVIVAGTYYDSVPLGGMEAFSNGDTDIFIKKLGPSGTSLWGAKFGDMSTDTVSAVAVGPSGEVFLQGETQGTITFDQPLTAVPDADAMAVTDPFIAKLNGLNGTPVSSWMFHGPSNEYVTGLALDPQGIPIIAGTFGTTIDLGQPLGVLTSKPKSTGEDFFVAKLKL